MTAVRDHFALLGVPRQVDLDATELERAYLRLAQSAHPDRFIQAEVGEQRAAVEHSTAVNEGYRVLRDPVKRAEYLCKLAGIDLDSVDPQRGAPAMDEAFLHEMVERREALHDAKGQGPAAVDQMRDEVAAELAQALHQAQAQLRAGEARDAARSLVRRRYLQRLLDEIDELAELN